MSILKGKTVLLTGSTGSIGKEIAKKLRGHIKIEK